MGGWWRVGGAAVVGAAAGTAAVAALTDGKPWMTVAGAVVGAVGTAFAPSVLDRLRQRADAQDALNAAAELMLDVSGPALLLHPSRGVVPFEGREREIEKLLTWCADPRAERLRLLTGPGGVGKSRLAAELIARLGREWGWVEVRDDAEVDALAKWRAVEQRQVLLVVDYTETRTGLAALLHEVAADEGRRVRVLLLARSAGDWWRQLGGVSARVRQMVTAAGAEVMTLAEQVAPGKSDHDLVAEAVPCFAAALGVEAPQQFELELSGRPRRILDLHAAALVVVLRSAQPRTGAITVDVADVLEELLDHERRYWVQSAQAHGFLGGTQGLNTVMVEQTVAVGTLLGARDRTQAAVAVGRVPGATASGTVADWLRELYPPDDDRKWLGRLQPDRLAELHVTRQLSGSEELLAACLKNLDERQERRALVTLARAAQELEAAEEILQRLLPPTAKEVVSFMVRFVDDILRKRFGREGGFAADDVVVVDPAMGAGSYLLKIVDMVAQTVEEREGKGAVPAQLKKLFGRLVGMERQAGPYAVAELRLSQTLKSTYGAEIAEKDQKLYTADTLDSQFEKTQLDLDSMYEPIAHSRRETNRVKRETPVQVVIGNPPYRERAKGMGGWIEQGAENAGHGVPLDAFKAVGRRKYEYVLSNLYVYFWRWATWKVFDARPEQSSGIVAFITTSGYTTGHGFADMREYLRRTTDEGWIIDLSPEGHQPDVSTRVFPDVQQPLCIGVFARNGTGNHETPALIHHVSLSGHRSEKFARLASLALDGPEWTACATGWHDRLQAAGPDDWLRYPALDDLMPWQTPGINPNRTWVYDPSPEILRARWERLIKAPVGNKAGLFKETRDRTIESIATALPGGTPSALPISKENSLMPNFETVAYRSFDRQKLLYDPRVIDYSRPSLWRVAGCSQIFASELHTELIYNGPGLTFSSYVPDMHHFAGSGGGRVLPLYRDRAAEAVNLAPNLVRLLSERLDLPVLPPDVLAYIAAVTAHGGYTVRFADSLFTPGVRVPLTGDPELWAQAVRIGKRVIWLHTYGERFVDPAEGRPAGPPKPASDQRAKPQVAIPGTVEGMPDDISYNAETATLYVGTGRISPVRPEVWMYEVSGMNVVKKWFGYRKKNPAGRKSSPLNDVHTGKWPAEFTTELLQLLHMLTLCVELEPDQADLLERICSGPLVTVADLERAKVFPVPPGACKAPAPEPPEAPTGL